MKHAASSSTLGPFTIAPIYIEPGETVIKGPQLELRLHRFQERVLSFFVDSDKKALFLSAPTGSGKTLTTILPLVAKFLGARVEYDGVTAVYPTRALAYDQFISLQSILQGLSEDREEKEGNVIVYRLNFDLSMPGGFRKKISARAGLVLLTSTEVGKIAEELIHRGELEVPSRINALHFIAEEVVGERLDYLIVVAVPEYPYLLLSRLYRSEPDAGRLLQFAAQGDYVCRIVEKLLREPKESRSRLARDLPLQSRVAERLLANTAMALTGDVLFMDEYHVWTSFEKPTALALVLLHILYEPFTGIEYRIVFSSATPDELTLKLLERLKHIISYDVIQVKPASNGGAGSAKIRGETKIYLEAAETRSVGPVSWLEAEKHLPAVVKKWISVLSRTERFIVFGRRPATVEEAARVFSEETRRKPVLVTGVTHPEFAPSREEVKKVLTERKKSGDLPLFGNYSIEIGVDLDNMCLAIVTAGSLGELLQRMGRVGRKGRDSTVIIVVPKSYAYEIAKAMKEKTISYEEFTEIIGYHIGDKLPGIGAVEDYIFKRTGLAKLRTYLPLAASMLSFICSSRDKIDDPTVDRVAKIFMEILEALELSNEWFSWLRDKVSKNPYTLSSLAAFRTGVNVKYRREDADQVEEASLASILANYRASLESPDLLVVHETNRKRVDEVLVLSADNTSVPKELIGTVMPAWLALRLLKIRRKKYQPGDSSKIVLEIIKRSDHPVYIDDYRDVVSELLNVYGYAIRVVCGGKSVACMILL